MKRIHLLRFAGSPEELEPLVRAAAEEGLRLGWLDLAGGAPPAPREPGGSTGAGLDGAVSAGAFRAVAVAPGRTVALKAVAGPPVLRDLLREHFLGCAAVVVRGSGSAAGEGDDGTAAGPEAPSGPTLRDGAAALGEAPHLVAEAEGFRVEAPGRAGRRFTTAQLAARLRKPRPWE